MPENRSERQHILTVAVENGAQIFPVNDADVDHSPAAELCQDRLHKLLRRRFKLLRRKTFLLLTLIRQLIAATTILLGAASWVLDDG